MHQYVANFMQFSESTAAISAKDKNKRFNTYNSPAIKYLVKFSPNK